MVERRERLVDDPELDLAREVKRGNHSGGQELDEEAVEGGEEVEVTACNQELLQGLRIGLMELLSTVAYRETAVKPSSLL